MQFVKNLTLVSREMLSIFSGFSFKMVLYTNVTMFISLKRNKGETKLIWHRQTFKGQVKINLKNNDGKLSTVF